MLSRKGKPINSLQDSVNSDRHDSSAAAIECRALTKHFRRTEALRGIDITAPTGSVYALLGRNGAGKSTLLQCLMGTLDAGSGSISVLGLDPQREPVALKQRLGYIPYRLPMYDWMTVNEILRFVRPFYTRWSSEDETGLMQRVQIPRDQKVGALSRGNRALLALVLAMAHQPDLVLPDECTSGMDAIARREFERSVIDALQTQGRTILFAGHQMDEMERICDWVAGMHEGKMLLEMLLDNLKSSVTLLRLATDSDAPIGIPNCAVLNQRRSGKELLATVRCDAANTALTLLKATPCWKRFLWVWRRFSSHLSGRRTRDEDAVLEGVTRKPAADRFRGAADAGALHRLHAF